MTETEVSKIWRRRSWAGSRPDGREFHSNFDRRAVLRLSLQSLECALRLEMTPSLTPDDRSWYQQEVALIFAKFLPEDHK